MGKDRLEASLAMKVHLSFEDDGFGAGLRCVCGMKGALGRKRWQWARGGIGVWAPAQENRNGRNGRTAVLTRRPTKVINGGTLARGTVAVVSWARRSRSDAAPVCNAAEMDPKQMMMAEKLSKSGKHT